LAKRKARKQTKGKPLKKRGLPWLGWLGIGLGIIAIIILVCVSLTDQPADSSDSGELRAAIVDQLYSLQPNEAFIEQTTQELKDYGFEVDVYQGDEVTVNLYRELTGHGYKLIVFRAHSGLLSREGEIIKKTCLFTNEPYSETRHVTEQLTGHLAMARISEHYPWVFAIGAKFVTRSMEGQFTNTAIIMMGCSCLYLDDLAQAFIDKGASVYLAWDATVDLDYVDNATIILIEKLCSEAVTVEVAVAETMQEKGPDPNYGALLKYYPAETGNKTIEELVKR